MNAPPACLVSGPAPAGSLLEPRDGEAAHLYKVLRLRPGDRVRLLDGAGLVGEAEVAALDARSCSLRVISAETAPRPPLRALALCIPKAQKAELVVQKAVELGMGHIDLIRADRSVAGWDNREHKRDRLEKIMLAAVKQSGNPWLPELVFHESIEAWAVARTDAAWFFGDLAPGARPLAALIAEASPTTALGVLIGPEGDFSEAERDVLTSACRPALFTPTVLRAETAALYAASLLAPRGDG